MLFRELHVFVRLSDNGKVILTVEEPESGEQTTFYNVFSPDEHPEFNEQIGNEIYSWLSLWADELAESEDEE